MHFSSNVMTMRKSVAGARPCRRSSIPSSSFGLPLMALFSVVVAFLLTMGSLPGAQNVNMMATASPPPQCGPEYVDELPPRLKKICAALANIAEFSSAMEQYLDDKVLRESGAVLDSGVKRQDVDHVFLRFGRRR